MKKVFLILGVVSFIVLGCSFKPNREQLIGKYCLNREENRDSIFLFKDNNYEHRYINSYGKLFVIEGEWEYDSLETEILLKDFTFFNEQGEDGLPRGNWFSKVKLINNEVRLMYSDENNVYFRKVLN